MGLAFSREASGKSPGRRPGSVMSQAGAGGLFILLQMVWGLPWAELGMGGTEVSGTVLGSGATVVDEVKHLSCAYTLRRTKRQ